MDGMYSMIGYSGQSYTARGHNDIIVITAMTDIMVSPSFKSHEMC